MGQNESAYNTHPSKRLTKSLSIAKIWASISYEHLVTTLSSLQERLRQVADSKGKKLHFEIKEGSDNSLLWKFNIRIKCTKLQQSSGAVESVRVLRLHEFLELHRFILAQLVPLSPRADTHDLGDLGDADTLCVSMIFAHVDSRGKLPSEGASYDDGPCSLPKEEDECCVCFDRKPEVVLPCHHCYCNQCIIRWYETARTCPMCRSETVDDKDQWVLTDTPDKDTAAREMNDSVLSRAADVGKPACS